MLLTRPQVLIKPVLSGLAIKSKKLLKSLRHSFFERPTQIVAPQLLGKLLKRCWRGQDIYTLITEVEAYRGQGDPASHAARGRTPRNAVMFGPGGFSYVYSIYGMYHCLNFVTEPEGQAGAVLIRGVLMGQDDPTSGGVAWGEMVSGPGKVCKKLHLRRNHTSINCLLPNSPLSLFDSGIKVSKSQIKRSTRIGIKVGTNLPWRWEWQFK